MWKRKPEKRTNLQHICHLFEVCRRLQLGLVFFLTQRRVRQKAEHISITKAPARAVGWHNSPVGGLQVFPTVRYLLCILLQGSTEVKLNISLPLIILDLPQMSHLITCFLYYDSTWRSSGGFLSSTGTPPHSEYQGWVFALLTMTMYL